MRWFLIFLLWPTAVFGQYNRTEWQHWSDVDSDCQDTRQEVLIRQSVIPAQLDSTYCFVISGLWLDPYTGKVFTDPKKLDVDHFVPLKNAYLSGGAEWSAEKKEAYANELDDPWHLIAVEAKANRQKGAKGPDAWLPPFGEIHCWYVDNWEAIKVRWGLTISSAELDIIYEVRQECPWPPRLTTKLPD